MRRDNVRLALGVLIALATLVAAPNVFAQASSSTPLFGRSKSADQPIDIAADALEIQQNQQVAVFKGNVEAIQGDIRLKADTLRVHYRQREGGDAAAQPAAQAAPRPNAPATPDTTGTIRRIEAIGHVFISSPSETAAGDRGEYDVDKKTVTLTGNVVLTKGQNVLKGQMATVDMTTGISTMPQAPGQRVRGLFQPERAKPGN